MRGQILVVILGALFAPAVLAGTYSGGTGEPNDPCQIAAVADWQQLMVRSDYWDKHFILTADLDLQGVTLTPVGSSSQSFTGLFDGQGFTISNAIIDQPVSDYVGLFGWLGSGGEIRNFGVEDVNITGHWYVGGLVGSSDGMLTSCYAIGNVTGVTCTGGLVGKNYGAVTSCYATGQVAGAGYAGYVGGLVGDNEDGTINSCYATGTVRGDTRVGGLVGINDEGTINCCHATGQVTSMVLYVGGLVGLNYDGMITSCYATGTVRGNREVGGLVGKNRRWLMHGGTITSCYATGQVTGTGYYVGGLVGRNLGTVTSSYATGQVSGPYYDVGGLVGSSTIDTVIACFWDVETSGTKDGIGNLDPDPEGVYGKTTTDMQIQSIFTDAGWDFVGETANGTEDIWRMCVNGVSYPMLWWQFTSGDFLCPDGIDFTDYSFFTYRWLSGDCADANDCDGADLDFSGAVDSNDLKIFCEHWLEGAGD